MNILGNFQWVSLGDQYASF